MSETQVRESLLTLFPRDERSDWDDVLRRAGRRRSATRRWTLALAVAFAVMLVVGSALALSGHLGKLFRGTPVNDITPRERFLMTQFALNGRVELIARRNGFAFYVIRQHSGRVCYVIGNAQTQLTPAQRAEQFRFGGADCPDPRIFPTRQMPVLNRSYFSYKPGDREWRMVGVQGFAADAVASVGVIGRDNQIIYTVPVEKNVYTAGKRGFMGARGVVALDDKGKVLWVQCFAVGAPRQNFPSGGCGRYQNSPPPKLPPQRVPRPPIEAPGPLVVQHGSADGATVDIRGSRIAMNFTRVPSATRRLLPSKTGRLTLGCFKLVTIAGVRGTDGAYATKPFANIVRMRPYSPFPPRPARPPFDGCTAMGALGHTWNDAHGTHDTIEIPLTSRGRAYLADRAVARDVAWLARARVFREIRYSLRPFASTTAARSLGEHVVPLEGPTSTPRAGKLGIWIGPSRRIVLVERAPSGRRLYLELRHGLQYRTNLLGSL
jgi:hypothetical protein